KGPRLLLGGKVYRRLLVINHTTVIFLMEIPGKERTMWSFGGRNLFICALFAIQHFNFVVAEQASQKSFTVCLFCLNLTQLLYDFFDRWAGLTHICLCGCWLIGNHICSSQTIGVKRTIMFLHIRRSWCTA